MTTSQNLAATPNADTPEPISPTASGAAVEQRAEWAIALPRSSEEKTIWWYRTLSLRLSDPDGTGPSVFHSRPRAEDELVDVIGLARTWMGVRKDFLPTLMVRNVQITAAGVAVGEWQTAPAPSKTKAVRS